MKCLPGYERNLKEPNTYKKKKKRAICKRNTKQPTPIKISAFWGVNFGAREGKRDETTHKIDSIVHLEKK